MYVTAHRVVSPTSGEEGFNALCYLHSGRTWGGMPPAEIPDREPGQLVATTIAVPPPGNRVRSYLDIVAPDDAAWTEVRAAFVSFLAEARGEPLPWVGVTGRCQFRLGMEPDLMQPWPREVAALLGAAEAVYASSATKTIASSRVPG